jgi:acyl-CoA thioester hydrolase
MHDQSAGEAQDGGTGSDFPIFTDIEVRFRDCDPIRHVNNAVYATYFEVGRQAYWKRFLDPRRYYEVPFVIARLEIDYRSPALAGEVLRVYLRTSWIGRHSFGTEYEIREREGGRLVAEGRSVQATVDSRSGAVIPMPEELRRSLVEVEGREIPGRPARGQDP